MDDTVFTHTPSETGQILLLTVRDYQRRVGQELIKRGIDTIRAKHSSVLMHIGGFGPSRMVDLAEAAGIKPQSMLKIINELESGGLVERCADPTDSRAKLIQFTPDGEKAITALAEITESIWQDYADIVGKENLQTTLDTLHSLTRVVYCGEDISNSKPTNEE